jgi:hypothetical protein
MFGGSGDNNNEKGKEPWIYKEFLNFGEIGIQIDTNTLQALLKNTKTPSNSFLQYRQALSNTNQMQI